MTLLAAYDRARAALAEASQVKDVLAIGLQLDHIKLHARHVQDRALLVEATILQMRAERKLGEMLRGLRDAGLLADKGRPGKRGEAETAPSTLDDIGVKRQWSMKAYRAASLASDDFEALCAATRERLASGRAILVDPIEQGAINGSRAIMSSRLEPDDSLDYFPTPPWATRALIEKVLAHLKIAVARASAREPACGEGHIAEVLAEYFADVLASDIFDYGYGEVADFLADPPSPEGFGEADWFITNPPFDEKAEAFLTLMLALARVGVAIFVRLQWLEGGGRYERIYSQNPPTLIAFFTERVNLCKGRWDPDGSTATAYVWLVWIKGMAPQPPFWIPPVCRDTLTRPDDAERFTQHPVARASRSVLDNASPARAERKEPA